MFARISTIIAILFFAMLAAASVQVVPRTDPPDDCTAGGIYCCNAVVGGSDPKVGLIADLLDIDLGPIKGLVGLNCSPLKLKAGPGGGNSCSQHTVCCTGHNFSGLIVTGCSHVNINI